MSNFKFKLSKTGIKDLFKSEEMKEYLDEVGEALAMAAAQDGGGKYEHRTHNAKFTAICNVYPDDKKAARNNRKKNTLLRAAFGTLKLSANKPIQ